MHHVFASLVISSTAAVNVIYCQCIFECVCFFLLEWCICVFPICHALMNDGMLKRNSNIVRTECKMTSNDWRVGSSKTAQWNTAHSNPPLHTHTPTHTHTLENLLAGLSVPLKHVSIDICLEPGFLFTPTLCRLACMACDVTVLLSHSRRCDNIIALEQKAVLTFLHKRCDHTGVFKQCFIAMSITQSLRQAWKTSSCLRVKLVERRCVGIWVIPSKVSLETSAFTSVHSHC